MRRAFEPPSSPRPVSVSLPTTIQPRGRGVDAIHLVAAASTRSQRRRDPSCGRGVDALVAAASTRVTSWPQRRRARSVDAPRRSRGPTRLCVHWFRRPAPPSAMSRTSAHSPPELWNFIIFWRASLPPPLKIMPRNLCGARRLRGVAAATRRPDGVAQSRRSRSRRTRFLTRRPDHSLSVRFFQGGAWLSSSFPCCVAFFGLAFDPSPSTKKEPSGLRGRQARCGPGRHKFDRPQVAERRVQNEPTWKQRRGREP